MPYKNNLLYLLELAGITLVLNAFAAGIYFLFIYKPTEKIENLYDLSGIEYLNRMNESFDQDRIKMFLLFSFIICLIIGYIILIVITPVTEIHAKLISKETEKVTRVSLRGGMQNVIDTYRLTFELDNGEKMSFPVTEMHYWTILEGNKGTLRYKKGFVYRYMGCFVTEIE